MIADLKLDEKQAVEFRKLQKEYMEKAQKEREAMKAEREKQREKMLAMREDKNAQMKRYWRRNNTNNIWRNSSLKGINMAENIW